MNNIMEMFSYSFIVNSLIVGIIISVCSALLGLSLVLRNNSMIGDGLSHVSFGAFAVATVFHFAPLTFAIPIVILVSFLIIKMDEHSEISNDTKIALISTSSLAIGTFLISALKGVNTDINNYLFGSILSISNKDVIISIILGIVVMILFIISYNKIFAITFDEKFAKSIGIATSFYDMLFAILCSITIVLGMRLLGSLLISSLIIFPVITTKGLFKTFKSVMFSSIVVSVISFIIGFIISYLYEVPTGSTIVIVNIFFLLIVKLTLKVRKIYCK